MPLSKELEYAMRIAGEALAKNNKGELLLTVRKRLWAAMGSQNVISWREYEDYLQEMKTRVYRSLVER